MTPERLATEKFDESGIGEALGTIVLAERDGQTTLTAMLYGREARWRSQVAHGRGGCGL